MALKSKTFTSGVAHPNTRYWIELIVKETAIDKEKNTSTIFFDLRARSDPTWDLQFSGKQGYIQANNKKIKEAYTNLNAWDGDGGAYNKRICSITKTFKHDSNGKLSINVKGYYDYSGILISGKWTLSAVSVSGTFKGTTFSLKPTLTVSIASQEAESIYMNWKSDLAISEVQIYDSTNTNLLRSVVVDSKKTGTVYMDKLVANTSYTYYLRVKTTAGVWSDKKSISAKTKSVAALTSSADLTFGTSLSVSKTNDSGLNDDLYFYVNDTFIKKVENIGNSVTVSFTDSELDTMYKLFGNKNTASTKVLILTKGETQNYSSYRIGTLTLTGIAKTAHIGVNQRSKRGMVWIGVNKVPKRAVVWIGVNGTPKRCI